MISYSLFVLKRSAKAKLESLSKSPVRQAISTAQNAVSISTKGFKSPFMLPKNVNARIPSATSAVA